MTYQIPTLPNLGDIEIDSKVILKKSILAHRALAELKGVTATMPNQTILINTLALQEAKDSSAIENIITTHDDLYRSDYLHQQFITPAAKEVHCYAQALQEGFVRVKKTKLLTQNDILSIQASIEKNEAGYRKKAGTALKNEQTGMVVYCPPQEYEAILQHMNNLEVFINTDDLCDWDVLVKMAVIHHQFESIHPFYDGNGRTGRVINILYLVQQGLLDVPILYLSRYINKHKADYYRLLQATRDTGDWLSWILYILDAVEKTAIQTTKLIFKIKELMLKFKHEIREKQTKIYSQDLINHLFTHPYTKIIFMCDELKVTEKTARKYLDLLVDMMLLSKMRLGKENYYVNHHLSNILRDANQ